MDNELRVGEAIIDLLAREYGVDVVFGIPGVHNIELYRGLHRS
ncbi:MAG: thiamine pyrophosphate-binding protein, partial [Actinomycetota bacterium]